MENQKVGATKRVWISNFRQTDEEKKVVDELADQFDVSGSDIIRASIRLAKKNPHLLDIKTLQERCPVKRFNPDRDGFNSFRFLDTLLVDGRLTVTTSVIFESGLISLMPGTAFENDGDEYAIFKITEGNEYYLELGKVTSVFIIDTSNDEEREFYPQSEWSEDDLVMIQCR